jgi:hypothetical protein
MYARQGRRDEHHWLSLRDSRRVFVVAVAVTRVLRVAVVAGNAAAGLDRFPPPAVVVFTNDLFAVSRHTGRAMI